MVEAADLATVVLGRANHDLKSRFALTDHLDAAVIEKTVRDASRQRRETLITFQQVDGELTISVGEGSTVLTRHKVLEPGDQARVNEEAVKALGSGRLVIASVLEVSGLSVNADGTVSDLRALLAGHGEDRRDAWGAE